MTAPRVLLVNPTITSQRNARFPLAVLSLSAALDGKYPSTIIDGNIDRDFIATVLRTISETRVGAVGVTIMGGPQLRAAIAVSKAIRERAPAIPIIWGGAFPTNCPQAALNTSYVDYAVRGQGEATFTELLDALFKWNRSTGIDLRIELAQQDEIVHNKARAFSVASLSRQASLRAAGKPDAVPDQDLSRPAHDRLSGRTGLPVPLHLLRSRRHVPRQDGVAPCRAASRRT